MIKLIASDIDGTLVEDGAAVLPEGFAELVTELVEKGIIFLAASGRSLISIENLFEPIRDKIFYCGCNGCTTGEYGKILFVEELDRELRNKMLLEIREDKRMVPYLTSPTTMYAEPGNEDILNWLVDSYHEKVEVVEDLTTVTDTCVKLSIYDLDHNPPVTFKEFQEKWKGEASVMTSGVVWLDVVKAGVSKATAVKHLQEHFGILPEETMTFGDQQNDIAMLKESGYSYAIGNALPEVKAVAKYLADTNINGGELKVIRRVLDHPEEFA